MAGGLAAAGGAYVANSQLNNMWSYFDKQNQYSFMRQLAKQQANTQTTDTKLDTEALKYKYHSNLLAEQAGYRASQYNTYAQIWCIQRFSKIECKQ